MVVPPRPTRSCEVETTVILTARGKKLIGMSSSMWTNIRLATLQDRIDSFSPRAHNPNPDSAGVEIAKENWTVDYKYAFHLATVGGAEALGIESEVGIFEVGMKWDALLVDYGLEDMAFDAFEDTGDLVDGFEKFVNCGDDRCDLGLLFCFIAYMLVLINGFDLRRNIVRVWVDGKTVCRRD